MISAGILADRGCPATTRRSGFAACDMPSRYERPAPVGYRVNCRQFRRIPVWGAGQEVNPSGELPSRSGCGWPRWGGHQAGDPGRSPAVVMQSGPAVVNMPPETDDEPGAEDDAAEEQENSEKRPKDQPRRDRRDQCAQLPPGSRSHHGTPGSQRGLGAASCASHLSFLSPGRPLRDGQNRAGN